MDGAPRLRGRTISRLGGTSGRNADALSVARHRERGLAVRDGSRASRHPPGHPARRVSRVTTTDGRSPGSRVTALAPSSRMRPSSDVGGAGLAAYSCGGSRGIEQTLTGQPSPRSLLIPEGNRHGHANRTIDRSSIRGCRIRVRCAFPIAPRRTRCPSRSVPVRVTLVPRIAPPLPPTVRAGSGVPIASAGRRHRHAVPVDIRRRRRRNGGVRRPPA